MESGAGCCSLWEAKHPLFLISVFLPLLVFLFSIFLTSGSHPSIIGHPFYPLSPFFPSVHVVTALSELELHWLTGRGDQVASRTSSTGWTYTWHPVVDTVGDIGILLLPYLLHFVVSLDRSVIVFISELSSFSFLIIAPFSFPRFLGDLGALVFLLLLFFFSSLGLLCVAIPGDGALSGPSSHGPCGCVFALLFCASFAWDGGCCTFLTRYTHLS